MHFFAIENRSTKFNLDGGRFFLAHLFGRRCYQFAANKRPIKFYAHLRLTEKQPRQTINKRKVGTKKFTPTNRKPKVIR